MFVGQNLTNLRILHGYSRKQLAKLLQVTEQSIWQYENGYTSPKMNILNELKRIFNVKSQYFYHKDILHTDSESNVNQNHIAYRATTINSSHKTRCEAKRIEFIDSFLNIMEEKLVYPQNEIEHLREETIDMMSNENYERKVNIERVAHYARQFLDLNHKGNDHLLYMLEKKGAFILEKSMGDKVDAYSLWTEKGRPFIILGNIKKSAVRRNFDLAHELGHLLLHYKVEFTALDKKSYREHEREANLFAGAFLLPEEEFREDVTALPKISNPKSYLDMKKKWLVSVQAMGYRAHSLRFMTYQQFRYFNMLINRYDYKLTEPLDDVIKIHKPGKVRSMLQLLFDDGYLSLSTLLDSLKVDIEFVTRLLGIEKAFFEKYHSSIAKTFTIKDLSFKAK